MNSLLLAVKANDVGAIQKLLTYSPNCRKLVNYQAPQNHETPLFVASVRGYDGVVRWLLNRGARVDATTSWGATALHAAAERGHDKIIKFLLERKAPLQVQTQYGDTALHLAAYRGHHRVVLLLLAAGIDTTIANSKGRTAVDEAEIAGHRIISKHLRHQRPEKTKKSSNLENSDPSKNVPMHTKPLQAAAQKSFPRPARQSSCPSGCQASNHGFDVESYLLPATTTPEKTSQHQARVQEWVMNSALDNHIQKTVPASTESCYPQDDMLNDAADVFAVPSPSRNTNFSPKIQPIGHARRKISLLRDIGKSQSCEGLCVHSTPANLVNVTAQTRSRRINSLERAVDELQNELCRTQHEMERAKADISDMQDMMRLCWAKGGVSMFDRTAVADGLHGRRFILNSVPSDISDEPNPPSPLGDWVQNDIDCTMPEWTRYNRKTNDEK